MSFFGIPIRNGLPIGLGSTIGFGSRAFSPASLFAAGEQGAWYDPSDFSTLFQDAAGTTPVTAVEQPVGLMLNKLKSKGVIGSDIIVNGTFATDSDWTKGTGWSIGSGVATKTAGTASSLSQAVTLTAGTSYLITYTLTRTAGTITARFTGGTTVSVSQKTSSGTYTEVLRAVSGNTTFEFAASADFDGTVDNVILQALPTGNHAIQTIDARRPVLSARVNQFTKSEDFSDAVWGKSNVTVTGSAGIAPNGTNTASQITAVATSGSGFLISPSFAAGTNTTSLCFKYTDSPWVAFSNASWFAYFNIQTGTVGSVGNGTASITALGNGWYRCTWNQTDASASVILRIRLATADGNASVVAGQSALIWGADLRVTNDGVGLPVYQRVNTATDYDTTGFPLYLRCDGTDDAMLTNSIDFSATNKMTVFTGLRKITDPTAAILFEFANTQIDFDTGSIALLGRNTFNFTYYGYASKGTTISSAVASSASFAAPITNVLTGTSDISGDSVVLRINTNQINSSTTDQGTGNYSNYPLYLFARGGSSFPFNGRVYSLIIRGAQSTATQIAQTENWVNGKTRAY